MDALIQQQLPLILAEAAQWAATYEKWTLGYGRELNLQEKADAALVGVKAPEKVRVAVVPRIPRPDSGILAVVNSQVGLITDLTAGLTLRYGILIRQDCAFDRNLLLHELVHTSQYERFGSIEAFLQSYLVECLEFGYPNGPLEKEAEAVAARICAEG